MNKKIILMVIVVMTILVALLAINIIMKNGNELALHTFKATVLENKGTSILVEPAEGAKELSSSDKIVVRVPRDGAVLEDLSQFAEGSKVKITYGGAIMESYPAQINAVKIEAAEE